MDISLAAAEGQEERSRGEWKWNGWQQYGDILLSAERERMDGQKRSHEDVAVFEHVDDAVFDSPSPVTPELLQVRTSPGTSAVSGVSDGSADSRPAATQPANQSE